MNNVEQKLRSMLETQNELNKVVHPEWEKQHYRWEDAVVVEAVELFDHLNWKWWKKYTKEPDYEQVKLEAIDIWHFILSRVIEDFGIDEGTQLLLDYFYPAGDEAVQDVDWDLVKNASRDFLAQVSYYNEDPDLPVEPNYLGGFAELLAHLGITIDDLYVTYVAKVELNRLRWANGYGTDYIKTWDGQEDNVWLAEYVKTLDPNAADFPIQVRNGLVGKYQDVERAAGRI